MATFHVYVEGAVDPSADGVRKLAQAISQRYGLPAADLLTRLGAGRFRVKANVDKVTAETYSRALQEVGARVTIEEALERAKSDVSGRTASTSLPPMNLRGSTQPPPRSQPSTPPATAPRASSPALPANPTRPGASSLPPANRTSTPGLGTAQRSGASSLPPANASRAPQPPMQSGLAAAFSTGGRAQSESGFDALGSGALSLSSVDGQDEEPASSGGAFAPPPEPIAVTLADDPPPPKPAAKAAKAASQPLDLFAPPDAEEAEAKVELATDEIEHRAKKMSTPPAGVPVGTPPQPTSAPNTPAMRRSQPSIQPPSMSEARTSAGDMPRGRFAAGVFLSILIGFVPAHFVAATRESTAFNKIDATVTSTQNSVEDEDGYRALDGFRDAQLSKKKSERNTIAWQSMLIWAVVGAGAAYVYFRRIPWKTA